MKPQLPPIKEKKKINIAEFVTLAKKVKKIFEEEEAYLEKNRKLNENRVSSRLIVNS